MSRWRFGEAGSEEVACREDPALAPDRFAGLLCTAARRQRFSGPHCPAWLQREPAEKAYLYAPSLPNHEEPPVRLRLFHRFDATFLDV